MKKTKLDIAIAIPGMAFNGNTFDSLSIGGSESAGYYMGRALAKLGHQVTVFCKTEAVRCADVDYLPIDLFRQWAEYTANDVVIVQRQPDLLPIHSRARFIGLWCHDLALGRFGPMVNGTAWSYDKIFVLSEFMRQQYKTVYGIADEMLFLTRNGVDLATVERARAALPADVKRNPLALVFSGRPERGLDTLLEHIMPRILSQEPNAKVYLSTYDNPVDQLAEFYSHCKALGDRLGSAVQYMGHLTKEQLYTVYLAAGQYVYPLPSKMGLEFDEISCVTGDTLVDMPRDYSTHPHGVPIKDLVGKSEFPVYCYDSENARITLGTVKWAAMTKRNAEVWRLTLDDGSFIRATPEHKIMRRDGTWCELRDLRAGDSLMPLYKHVRISVNLNNGWENEHRLVGEWMADRKLNGENEHVHHVDGYWDTSPENLRVLSRSEHFSITHKGKKRGAIELQRQRASLHKFFSSLSDEERAAYFAARPRAVRSMWEGRRRLPPEEYTAWLKWRSEKRDLGFMSTPEWAESCRKGGTASLNSQWTKINAMPLEQRQAWLDARTERMREARWNHSVVSVAPDGTDDVYDMEVGKHHNFVAGGIVVHNCISAMEAQACGLPMVATARGALPETLAPGAGALVAWTGHEPAFFDAFADSVLRLMRDPDAWRAASAAALERGATLDWDGVATQWSEMIEREIRARSADLGTMANHFWRHSDIYAAKECLKRLPADDAKTSAVRERIATDFAFMEEPDGWRKQYEKIGGTHNADVINWSNKEPRYHSLKGWLEAQIAKLPEGEALRVLDYGCAHGGYAINLLAELPRLRITGVDIDLHGIEMAYGFAEKMGVADRWRGVVGDLDRLSDPNLPEMAEEYDVVLAQEVLEHVPNPVATLKALEARLRDGGTVYATVPFGPWEYSDFLRYPHRAHVREFDLHDLAEMLDVKGDEGNVTKRCMPFGFCPETEDPLGWWVVTYTVTEKTRGVFGEIDMERKLWIQRPRQTLSACIMAGPRCEETLHWCLRSLVHVADEVIIADCGMSAEALRIIETYRWTPLDGKERHHWLDIRVIPGVDPKTEGFETPRNIALAKATQDWVLWIDTDEKLLQSFALAKYLRPNTYQGYSIRQHHFAVDTAFDADLPVRVFRNNGKLRFIGMIHEHPESEVNAGPGRTLIINDVHIPHVGYLIESGRREKFHRNWPMLQADAKKYPNRKLMKHMVMRDEMLRLTYELQQNGHRVNDEMRDRARNVIQIWRENFRGKGHFTNSNPINYYSQALAILGEGFDFALQLGADKVEAKVNGATRIRFANLEDLEEEVKFRARQAAEPFASTYY